MARTQLLEFLRGQSQVVDSDGRSSNLVLKLRKRTHRVYYFLNFIKEICIKGFPGVAEGRNISNYKNTSNINIRRNNEYKE